jgi:DNA adenine methylase
MKRKRRLSNLALRYFGGKQRLARRIVKLFPQHKQFYSLCGGGGSDIFAKAPTQFEVYNELNEAIANYFVVLKTEPGLLMQALQERPCVWEEFPTYFEPCPEEPIEWARRTYWYATFSRSGGGTRWDSQISRDRFARATLHEFDHLLDASNRLQSVEIWNQDCFSLIPEIPKAALIYIDPPYPHRSRGSKDDRHKNPETCKSRAQYGIDWEDEQHEQLRDLLKHRFAIVSSRENGLYEDLFQGWTKVFFTTRDGCRKKAIEVAWLSPAVEERRRDELPQIPFFKTEPFRVQRQRIPRLAAPAVSQTRYRQLELGVKC